MLPIDWEERSTVAFNGLRDTFIDLLRYGLVAEGRVEVLESQVGEYLSMTSSVPGDTLAERLNVLLEVYRSSQEEQPWTAA